MRTRPRAGPRSLSPGHRASRVGRGARPRPASHRRDHVHPDRRCRRESWGEHPHRDRCARHDLMLDRALVHDGAGRSARLDPTRRRDHVELTRRPFRPARRIRIITAKRLAPGGVHPRRPRPSPASGTRHPADCPSAARRCAPLAHAPALRSARSLETVLRPSRPASMFSCGPSRALARNAQRRPVR